MTQHPGLLPQHQTALTRIQVRQHHLEPQGELAQRGLGEAHTRTTISPRESSNLFLYGSAVSGIDSATPPDDR
jgi:hypothetical protein